MRLFLLASSFIVTIFLLAGCDNVSPRAKLLPVTRDTTAAVTYPWLSQKPDPITQLVNVITPKANYLRLTAMPGTFGEWVQHLPLKAGNPPVLTDDGIEAPNQFKHAAVVNIDAGKNNLQLSANAILRLRAEYLFSKDWLWQINFPTKSGTKVDFRSWVKEKKLSPDHKALIEYLQELFPQTDATTLASMLKPVKDIRDMEPGDIMLKRDQPEFAVLVLDVVQDPATNARYFLLGTSHYPAQDFYVIINPSTTPITPWYPQANKESGMPEGVFKAENLMRF